MTPTPATYSTEKVSRSAPFRAAVNRMAPNVPAYGVPRSPPSVTTTSSGPTTSAAPNCEPGIAFTALTTPAAVVTPFRIWTVIRLVRAS